MASGWYARFVERLDPAERSGELLFGLIMVLTFTLGAGIELADRAETGALLLAALGCNTAWGIIDAALYLVGRLSERGRRHRLIREIQTAPSRVAALALIDRELAERLEATLSGELRAAVDAHVLDQVLAAPRTPNRITASDLWAALAVFWLVFLTALPALVPFFLIHDSQLAMRVSNGILIGLLFYVGWRWADHAGSKPFLAGTAMALIGVVLVVVAIALGG
jgi:VIT1/CCC1 family predicted Fe2+/Mn2+ transporter